MDKYRLVGASYDFLSRLYSGDSIRACKLAMITKEVIKPGEKILFVGAGHGKDAIRAAELGASVTVVDISPTMMSQLNKQIAAHSASDSLDISTTLQDILKLQTFGHYDIVVSNFFLNVFDPTKMRMLLDHINKLISANGRIIIGDFSPLEGRFINRLVQNIYWYAAATAFFVLAGNAIHKIYDYQPILEEMGYVISQKKYFKFLGRNLYCSLLAERNDAE